VQEAGRLTRYAVETRYPGVGEPVTEDEHEKAVTLAEQTVRWVEQRVEHSRETDGDDEGG
jgi:HEPN domain-containing protein